MLRDRVTISCKGVSAAEELTATVCVGVASDEEETPGLEAEADEDTADDGESEDEVVVSDSELSMLLTLSFTTTCSSSTTSFFELTSEGVAGCLEPSLGQSLDAFWSSAVEGGGVFCASALTVSVLGLDSEASETF